MSSNIQQHNSLIEGKTEIRDTYYKLVAPNFGHYKKSIEWDKG